MNRRKTADVLWLALQYARQNRLNLIDAYGGNTKEKAVRDALSDVRAFESLQKKLFGTTRTRLEAELEKAESVNLLDLESIKRLVDENPDLLAAAGSAGSEGSEG